jgi:hypothetical protein
MCDSFTPYDNERHQIPLAVMDEDGSDTNLITPMANVCNISSKIKIVAQSVHAYTQRYH